MTEGSVISITFIYGRLRYISTLKIYLLKALEITFTLESRPVTIKLEKMREMNVLYLIYKVSHNNLFIEYYTPISRHHYHVSVEVRATTYEILFAFASLPSCLLYKQLTTYTLNRQ